MVRVEYLMDVSSVPKRIGNRGNEVMRIANHYKSKMRDGKDAVSRIYEFLYHNELGLAFEELCAILYEDGIVISSDDYLMLKSIGEYLEPDSYGLFKGKYSELWTDLLVEE